jgi:hypothetical protein
VDRPGGKRWRCIGWLLHIALLKVVAV